MNRVCIFCGSSKGGRDIYVQSARQMGAALAGRGLELVYGGGHVGLMGAAADGTLAAGGRVIGVIPKALDEKELTHKGLTELHVVGSMHERKAMMAELSDGFIALPGGFGTLDEFAEIVTWAQLGIHQKPMGMLNVAGYFDTLLAFFDHSVAEGFVRDTHRAMVLTAAQPEHLLDMMLAYQPVYTPKWVDKSEM
jgi:uncharacterized protein (TIGR00730 family)